MSFVPRTNTDGMSDTPYYSGPWNPYWPSDPMPNCTAYAFGRFAEAGGITERPDLSLGNAEDWWGHSDSYARGQTPQLGAVLCLADGPFSELGHVCIVEQINPDGSILTSNSAWSEKDPVYFYMETREPPNYNPYGYTFQGFIYNPYITPAEWHAKPTGSYSKTSSEGQDNALMIAAALLAGGWELPAIAAFLGNGAGESGLNPWRWESDYIPTVAEFNGWTPEQQQAHGYGLVQFTPAAVYINPANASTYASDGYNPNFANSPGAAADGGGQIAFLRNHIPNDWLGGNYDYYYDDFINIGVDIGNFYYMTFDEFKSGNNGDTLANLVGAFELKYERPADWAAAQSYAHRVSEAQWWLDWLRGQPFPGQKKLLWLLLKAAKNLRERGI